MALDKIYDVIIVGGSYAGLSAAMALGRSIRTVLIIDSKMPCNRQTPYSHNFITQDGKKPAEIAQEAREQVSKYDTVTFHEGLAISALAEEGSFMVKTESGDAFRSRKLLFTTGLKDEMLDVNGFAECWGISVLHCPYCHGYEVKNQPIGIISNGDIGFEFCKMIYNWSKDLRFFTNGKSTLTAQQTEKLSSLNIPIIQEELQMIKHEDGYLEYVELQNGGRYHLSAMFAKLNFSQHCSIPEQLGCRLNEHGYIEADGFGRTSVPGVFAAGDNASMFRSLAAVIAAGTMAGVFANKELIEEDF